MNIIAFMQYISFHLHTVVKKYTWEHTLTTSTCMRPDFVDPAEQQKKLQEKLLAPSGNSTVSLTSINQNLIYSTLYFPEFILLIGPIRLDSPLQIRRELTCKLADITDNDWISSVFTLNYWDYFRELVLIHNLFAEKTITENDILLDNCVDENLQHTVQENLTSILFEKQEMEEPHNSYQQEVREQTSIENGDLESLERSFEEDFSGTFGTLSKNKLRQYKNLGIVVITLASRSAIRGGMNPEVSFSLSDNYIQKIEEINEIGALMHIIRDAERDYTRKVHEIKLRQANARKKTANPHVEQCKDYIFSHLHDRLTIQEIAFQLGFNANYLSELFKEHEGVSLSEYILNEKITRAKNLLIYSQYTYIEIATYLGFSSQSHLGKQFKKVTGYTLKQFRDTFGVKGF